MEMIRAELQRQRGGMKRKTMVHANFERVKLGMDCLGWGELNSGLWLELHHLKAWCSNSMCMHMFCLQKFMILSQLILKVFDAWRLYQFRGQALCWWKIPSPVMLWTLIEWTHSQSWWRWNLGRRLCQCLLRPLAMKAWHLKLPQTKKRNLKHPQHRHPKRIPPQQWKQ